VRLIYSPKGGERREFPFELEDLTWAEVRALQKVTGAPGLVAFGDMLGAADGAAIPALLWVLRKREEPTLKFADLDTLRISEVTVEEDEQDAAGPKAPTTAAETDPAPTT